MFPDRRKTVERSRDWQCLMEYGAHSARAMPALSPSGNGPSLAAAVADRSNKLPLPNSFTVGGEGSCIDGHGAPSAESRIHIALSLA